MNEYDRIMDTTLVSDFSVMAPGAGKMKMEVDIIWPMDLSQIDLHRHIINIWVP